MARITSQIRKAYSEVDELIDLFTEKEKQKIPQEVREFIKKEKDKEYVKNINPDIPIKDQGLKQETLEIIAYLNLEYICEDDEEKARLKRVYKQNEEKYKKLLQIDFKPDIIFKKEDIKNEINEEKQILPIQKEESFISKTINKIIKFFKIKKI